jgi:hypothetical protein
VTLVHWVKQKDDWLIVEEAIDHVIDVTGDKYKRARSKTSGTWIKSWALVGIELDANEPTYRSGLLGWMNYIREMAGNSAVGSHFDSGLFRDRDGLREFLDAVGWDREAVKQALTAGILSLRPIGERHGDGKTWCASWWSHFTTSKQLAAKRDAVLEFIPDGKIEETMTRTAWDDLEKFDEFVKRAGSLTSAGRCSVVGKVLSGEEFSDTSARAGARIMGCYKMVKRKTSVEDIQVDCHLQSADLVSGRDGDAMGTRWGRQIYYAYRRHKPFKYRRVSWARICSITYASRLRVRRPRASARRFWVMLGAGAFGLKLRRKVFWVFQLSRVPKPLLGPSYIPDNLRYH